MVTGAIVDGPVSTLPDAVPREDPVRCALAGENDSGRWDSFVRSAPSATGYHLWGWRGPFERGLGHRCHYLIAARGSRVTGVLPLVEVRSLLFGRALSSLPYVNYGGVVARDPETACALLDYASGLAHRRALSYLLLRHRRRQFPALPSRSHKVTMLLPLAETPDAMWSGLDRKVRNQVRKAEKSGVTTSSGGVELLDEFYRIFARNMRDLGTPVYGRRLFGAILTAFPETARLHIARLGGTAIAGALSYAFGDCMEVPSASSLREHRAVCPNHALYWSIMTGAIAEGRHVFDFGRSTPNDGTYNFKEQWGASPEQLWWEYALQGDARVPTDDRQSAKFHTTIEAWKRLPLALANTVGPRIARSIA